MKLYELARLKKGTYAGVRFSDATTQALVDYMHDANIPNMLDKDKLHTTLLYSRVHCPGYQPNASVKYIGKPTGFEIWDTDSSDGGKTKCLVLKYSCPELEKRHKELRKQHGATHDYPSYNPHITLSYDIGNKRIGDFPDITKFLDTITIVSEYSEDLDLDWSPSK